MAGSWERRYAALSRGLGQVSAAARVPASSSFRPCAVGLTTERESLLSDSATFCSPPRLPGLRREPGTGRGRAGRACRGSRARTRAGAEPGDPAGGPGSGPGPNRGRLPGVQGRSQAGGACPGEPVWRLGPSRGSLPGGRGQDGGDCLGSRTGVRPEELAQGPGPGPRGLARGLHTGPGLGPCLGNLPGVQGWGRPRGV